METAHRARIQAQIYNLQMLYGVFSDHPDFPSSDWRRQVVNDETRLGYWDWVQNAMEQDS